MIKYKVSGLTCGGCVTPEKNKLTDHAEIVEVTLTPPVATLSNPKSDLDTLNKALNQIGDYQLSAVIIESELLLSNQKTKSRLPTYLLLLLVSLFLLALVISNITLNY